MPCDCVDRINAKLAPHFAELDLLIEGPRVPLVRVTVRPNKVLRGGIIKAMKPQSSYMVPSFCPFCGIQITDDEIPSEMVSEG